ncbi:zygote arrest protein 1 [Elysia marginata]|uniref:Zygote arrest protein 1 n=1 Tax=Elysia marginata TaxID=1093978 RepID=A0AAV4G089_9GAST|nr:zygote arrest protein 1 [Elysia marginata]
MSRGWESNPRPPDYKSDALTIEPRCSNQVVFGQICEQCKTEQMPKRVSRLRCATCSEFDCDCEQKRHTLVEPKMMHRPDLCRKCLSGDPCVV